jgi:hypothetical protein
VEEGEKRGLGSRKYQLIDISKKTLSKPKGHISAKHM